MEILEDFTVCCPRLTTDASGCKQDVVLMSRLRTKTRYLLLTVDTGSTFRTGHMIQ